MHEEMEDIRNAALFSSLLPEEWQQLVSSVRIRDIKAHDLLFAQGDDAVAFYFVVAGAVRLYRLSPTGDEKVIEILMPGSTFAEAVVFLGGRYPVYAAALVDTKLVEIPTSHFLSLLETNRTIALRMLAGMSARLHQLINDVQALSLETAGQRVAGYILEQFPKDVASADIHIPIHKNVLASRLGVKPETFSRVLATLRGAGLIAVAGNDIHVPDRAALERWRDNGGARSA